MGELIKIQSLKIILALLLFASIFFVIFLPLWKTKMILNMAADSFSQEDMEAIGWNGKNIVLFNDGWGNPILYTKTYEKKYVIYCLISRGRDGILDTNDDIVVERTVKRETERRKHGHED